MIQLFAAYAFLFPVAITLGIGWFAIATMMSVKCVSNREGRRSDD